MATPRKPRTRKPANTMQIDLVPAHPKRRRTPRQPTTYVAEKLLRDLVDLGAGELRERRLPSGRTPRVFVVHIHVES
jgi:hypothetical protein